MALIKWEHPSPATDPFAALYGDTEIYAVHVCIAHDFQDLEMEVVRGFLLSALQSALQIRSANDLCLLCHFDPVYSILVITLTDGEGRHDEPEVYKLILEDWDEEMQAIGTDSEYEIACGRMEARMISILQSAFASSDIVHMAHALKERGCQIFFTSDFSRSKASWKELEI